MSTIDQLRQERLNKIKKMREIGWDPYPAHYDKTHTVEQTRKNEGQTVKTAGKIYSFRTHGNIAFADLKDETGKIQIFFQKKVLGEEAYKNLSLIDIGDFLGIEGTVTKTIAGEISIIPARYTILAKAILPLPHEHFGLKNIEDRYRQRYLDLLLNPDVRRRFNIRTKLVKAIRQYLDDLGFWEVETPILQPLYGGANAKPFTTYFNALGQDMYLRIAVELYLKRLIAGGYEKVYEIGKDFRNEGLDRSHNPEFTMLEWYEAYADYHRIMDVTEGLFKYLAQNIYANTKIQVDDKVVDIGGKWPRIEMTEIIQRELKLDVEKESVDSLSQYCKKEQIETLGGETKGQLIFSIFEHKVTDKLIEPTWIIDYPEDVSPLSKGHRTKKGWVERFEGYIGGKEICDGWSELTDPEIQRQRWLNDEKAARKDKEEAQHIDEDYITSMEYGMPPTGGIGIGIDRLTMFFTNTWIVKETILFPTLKNLESRSQNQASKTTHSKLTITRDQAYKIVTAHLTNKNLVKHCLAVEAAMRGLAKYFCKEENITCAELVEVWGILGLVHDADWEETQNDVKEHSKKTSQWLKEAGENNPELHQALLAHNYQYDGEQLPQSQMAWALYCCDDLTGIIVANALIMPDKKLSSVTVESVMKKMNSKSFAAGANREQIKLCDEKLGIKLKDFVRIVLQSMQSNAADLGL